MLILQLLSFEKTEMEGDDCYFLAYTQMDNPLLSKLTEWFAVFLDNFELKKLTSKEEGVNEVRLNNNLNLDRMLYPKLTKETWRYYNKVEFNRNYSFEVRFKLTDDIKQVMTK